MTAFAIHSSGQLLAAGYADGTIAFWSVEDEDRPLMVRTIEKIDVNYPDAEELDKALSGEPPVIFSPGLEPIYKIQWTSFGALLGTPYAGQLVFPQLLRLGGRGWSTLVAQRACDPHTRPIWGTTPFICRQPLYYWS